jgi:ABC-2 type transport system permease protein
MVIALYKKTTLRILKSTISATNLLIGCVLAILLAVALFVAGPEKILNSMEISGQSDMINQVACYVIAAMIAMTNTAAVSLALEGKTIWLIKSLPIPSKILYDSYLLTNLTFTIPTSLICSTLFSISLKTDFTTTILLFITPLIFSVFTAVVGIFIGNRLAYYDWQEEVQLIKQSMMSMLGILGGLFLISICGVIANSGILPFSSGMITLVLDMVFLVLAVVIYTKEINRPIK